MSMSYDYDPNETQRDRPRRSSLHSHKFLLEQHRKGSIPAMHYDPTVEPMPRRGSVATFRRPSYAANIQAGGPRKQSLFTAPTEESTGKKTAGRSRAATVSQGAQPPVPAAGGVRPSLAGRRATTFTSVKPAAPALPSPPAQEEDAPSPAKPARFARKRSSIAPMRNRLMSVSEAYTPPSFSPSMSEESSSRFQAANGVTFSNSFASGLNTFDSKSTLANNTWRNSFVGPAADLSPTLAHDDPLSSASASESQEDGYETGPVTDSSSSPGTSPAVKVRPLPAQLDLRRPSVRFAPDPSMPSPTTLGSTPQYLRPPTHTLSRHLDASDDDDGYFASDDYKASPEDEKIGLPQGLTVPGRAAPSLFESRHSIPYLHPIDPTATRRQSYSMFLRGQEANPDISQRRTSVAGLSTITGSGPTSAPPSTRDALSIRRASTARQMQSLEYVNNKTGDLLLPYESFPGELEPIPWYKRIPIVSSITKHFSPIFIWSIIDCREYFWPITKKKMAWVTFYAALITGLVLLDKYFDWTHYVKKGFLAGIFPIMVFMIALDPVTTLYFSAISVVPPLRGESCRPDWEGLDEYYRENYPAGYRTPSIRSKATSAAGSSVDKKNSSDNEQEDDAVSVARTVPSSSSSDSGDEEQRQLIDSNTQETALIIPCHDSELETTEVVLAAALRMFKPENIFIVENGNSPKPEDWRFHDLIRAIDPRINYIWSPYGNKNVAEYVGARAATAFKYIMTIDDDVVLPNNYGAPTHLISEFHRGVSFPIRAVDDLPDGKSTFVAWQNQEYIFAGMLKYAEREVGGIMFPHGAGSFWVREDFMKVLHHVDLIFYGDDLKKGMACMELDVGLSIESQVCLETVVPTTFAALPLPNYYTQRVRSWEMARHMMYWHWFKLVFHRARNQTLNHSFTQKFSFCYAIFANVIDWIRLPALIIFGAKAGRFWTIAGPMLVLSALPALLMRYWKARHRPDLQSSLFACCTMGIYKVMYWVCSVAGMLRLILTYNPQFKHRPDLNEIEARQGEAMPFWMYEKFDRNPGYLVEEDEKAAAEFWDEQIAETRSHFAIAEEDYDEAEEEEEEEEERPAAEEHNDQPLVQITDFAKSDPLST